jgi:hypothetical protein
MTESRNPLGLGLAIAGAAVMALSAFLPLDEPANAFRTVASNTLIQHGGWALIALAVGIAVSGFRAYQRGGNAQAIAVVLCVLAGLAVAGWATDDGLRTLYPIGADGGADTSKPGVVVPLGIAVYVTGLGVAAAFIGALMLPRAPIQGFDHLHPDAPALPIMKKCPDCAETILNDAKVCKHCGYRFTATSSPAPAPKPAAPKTISTKTTRVAAPVTAAPPKTAKVKCGKCQRVQAVPQDLSLFVCEACGARLKRRGDVNR